MQAFTAEEETDILTEDFETIQPDLPEGIEAEDNEELDSEEDEVVNLYEKSCCAI